VLIPNILLIIWVFDISLFYKEYFCSRKFKSLHLI